MTIAALSKMVALTVAQTQGAAAANGESASSSVSALQLVAAGGVVGYVILLLSVAAMALMVMHAMQIRMRALAPEEHRVELARRLDARDAAGALQWCRSLARPSFLTRVMEAALARCQRSAFGFLELRSALEEAGQEQVARLYRSTDGLGLIANIAPMLGLLGTVLGMVGAFDTISASEGFARPDQLAGDISQALVTTLMGLTLAIPATAAFTFFRNRIDALSTDIASMIEELAWKLEAEDAQERGAAAPPAATEGVARPTAPVSPAMATKGAGGSAA
ncbi:MAG: MotA/TolQ/ExbB proton channel family protein [Planctomycetota bacterium]|nr:MAG: MotA/TolQ/ExbB proton channel family protein [Planctomycetota bacterium]